MEKRYEYKSLPTPIPNWQWLELKETPYGTWLSVASRAEVGEVLETTPLKFITESERSPKIEKIAKALELEVFYAI
jgi:hypothetical protein